MSPLPESLNRRALTEFNGPDFMFHGLSEALKQISDTHKKIEHFDLPDSQVEILDPSVVYQLDTISVSDRMLFDGPVISNLTDLFVDNNYGDLGNPDELTETGKFISDVFGMNLTFVGVASQRLLIVQQKDGSLGTVLDLRSFQNFKFFNFIARMQNKKNLLNTVLAFSLIPPKLMEKARKQGLIIGTLKGHAYENISYDTRLILPFRIEENTFEPTDELNIVDTRKLAELKHTKLRTDPLTDQNPVGVFTDFRLY